MKRLLFLFLLLPFFGFSQVQAIIEEGTKDTIVITTSATVIPLKVATILSKDSVIKVLFRGQKDSSITSVITTTVRRV